MCLIGVDGGRVSRLARITGSRAKPKTSTRRVFGLSSGAIIALYTAIEHRGVERLALYEPPLTIDGANPSSWVPQFERAMAACDPAAAMTEIIKGTGDRSLMTRLPRFVLTSLLRAAIARNAKEALEEDISIRELIPTVHFDIRVVRESLAMVNPRISELHSDVLLLGGDKTARHHRLALDALAKRLPDAGRVELKGIGHLAADNRGQPDEVARIVGDFLAG
jgi:pimeloyl-ACP methyl ester carboxylesterase